MEKLMNYGFVNKKKKGSACKTGIYFVYYGALYKVLYDENNIKYLSYFIAVLSSGFCPTGVLFEK
jgi:predicted transcriptional regulator